LQIPKLQIPKPQISKSAILASTAMRYLASQPLVQSLFRAGFPWVLVAVLMLGNLILSQSSAVIH
jgi:hypothetical protein